MTEIFTQDRCLVQDCKKKGCFTLKIFVKIVSQNQSVNEIEIILKIVTQDLRMTHDLERNRLVSHMILIKIVNEDRDSSLRRFVSNVASIPVLIFSTRG